MSNEWTWPPGKTFGELTAAEKIIAGRRASAQLERELQANAAAISAVLGSVLCHICDGEADGSCAICDKPVCDDDARMSDGGRYCVSCAPVPGEHQPVSVEGWHCDVCGLPVNGQTDEAGRPLQRGDSVRHVTPGGA